MCLTLAWNDASSVSTMAPLLSHIRGDVEVCWKPSSCKSIWIQVSSLPASEAVMYSASQMDKETDFAVMCSDVIYIKCSDLSARIGVCGTQRFIWSFLIFYYTYYLLCHSDVLVTLLVSGTMSSDCLYSTYITTLPLNLGTCPSYVRVFDVMVLLAVW